MALTEAQRAQTRLYMGWPSRFKQTSNELEQAMSALDVSPEDLLNVVALLPKIDNIDTLLTRSLSGAKVDQAGSVKLKGDNGASILRKEGRRLVRQLSSVLGCPVGTDHFSSGRGFAGSNMLIFG
jgi:hypothetical protein